MSLGSEAISMGCLTRCQGAEGSRRFSALIVPMTCRHGTNL